MKFTVRIIEQPVHRDVVVEAPDVASADEIGVAAARVTGAKVGFVRRAEDDARLGTYTCHWCSAQTEKHLWGPGRVHCPNCGKVAPSAAELPRILTATSPRSWAYCVCQSAFSLPAGQHTSQCGGKLPVAR